MQGLHQTHTMICIGPSQYGKSSFINNLSGSSRAEVGIEGCGESVTSVPKLYPTTDVWSVFPGNSFLNIIDVPGFYDTGLRISTEEIFQKIRELLAGSHLNSIDCVLVFQSLAESIIGIRDSLKKTLDLFGPKVKSSILVIASKADSHRANRMKPTVEKQCAEFEVPFIEWINDHSEYHLPDEQKQRYMNSLREQLSEMTPYALELEEALQARIREKALVIRENYPDRLETRELQVEVDVGEPYEESDSYTTTCVEKKYKTYDDLKKEAERIQPSLPRDFPISKEIAEKVKRTVYETKQDFETFGRRNWYGAEKTDVFSVLRTEAKEIDDVQTTNIIEYVMRPLEMVMKQLSFETESKTKTEWRTTKKIRMSKEVQTRKVQVERYPEEFYDRLAAAEMMNEFWIGKAIEKSDVEYNT